MNLIIIHKNKSEAIDNKNIMLQFALSEKLIAGIVIDGLSKSLCWNSGTNEGPQSSKKNCRTDTIYAVPEQWDTTVNVAGQQEKLPQPSFDTIIRYNENIRITPEIIDKIDSSSKSQPLWPVITNGQFVTSINNEHLGNILTNIRADIIAVNAKPALLNKQEKIRLTTENNIVGFRRLYSDSAELVPCPNNWPHYLFIKTHAFKKLVSDGVLPESFSEFIEKCRSNSFIIRAANIGGTVLDLCTEGGLLEFCTAELETRDKHGSGISISNITYGNPRCIGNVLFGNNIQIGENVIITGPAIVGDNVSIEEGAVINSSIIGSGAHVPQNRLVNNTILRQAQHEEKSHDGDYGQNGFSQDNINPEKVIDTTYRNWPRFSYARCLKRIADCIFAVIVLILFTPLMPFIALAIKLNSPGPVFFKDKRQGLHGREFNCLKFRTMVTGADKIQEKLKSASHVDGPQFKMVNDPRISTVGLFLRDTYIDEIPQFFNVLLGQMSVVGPRPSPESENTLCPPWRDARLSVRPGITGLWQVRRTRLAMRDFQEWILYDTQYVRNLSLKTDIRICLETAKKLIDDFINQF